MDITLSDKIRWFSDTGKIKLAFNRNNNIFNMNGFDYELRYLDEIEGNKGGNANVFMICDPAEPENEAEHLVIKICKKPLELSSNKYKRRFQREIIALNKIRKASKNKFIVEFFENGNLLIDNYHFPFYTMEKCQKDLTNYLSEKELHISEKVALCYYIIQGFCDLHGLKIYHRDIKSDNFLVKENICKIGDLGLVDFRDMDVSLYINEKGEKIGAFGWESPEVMNKLLTERISSDFDCKIDYSSDIFQLGKLFWFIVQGNLPIGLVKQEDFLIDDNDLFELLCKMLEHKKGNNRRPTQVFEVKNLFETIAKKYSVI
jgi:serine/threonine protein kinase